MTIPNIGSLDPGTYHSTLLQLGFLGKMIHQTLSLPPWLAFHFCWKDFFWRPFVSLNKAVLKTLNSGWRGTLRGVGWLISHNFFHYFCWNHRWPAFCLATTSTPITPMSCEPCIFLPLPGSSNVVVVLWWQCILSGQIIVTSHDLAPKGITGIPLFQGNPGWWNIIIWPDIMSLCIITCFYVS